MLDFEGVYYITNPNNTLVFLREIAIKSTINLNQAWFPLKMGPIQWPLKTNECSLKRDYSNKKYIWTNPWCSHDIREFSGE